MFITITLSDISEQVEVGINTTVKDLKIQFGEEAGFDPECFFLYFEGDRLQNHRTILGYGISADTEIEAQLDQKAVATKRLEAKGYNVTLKDLEELIRSGKCTDDDVDDYYSVLGFDEIKRGYRNTLITTACSSQSYSIIKKLIEFGLNVNELNPHWAYSSAYQNKNPLMIAALDSFDNSFFVAEFLLSLPQTDVGYRDARRQTALHGAAYTSDWDLMRLFLSKGASPSMTCKLGNTPLHVAVQQSEPSHRCIVLLVIEGAPIDLLNNEGHSALHIACCKGHSDSIEALLREGASASILTPNRETPLMLAADRRDIDKTSFCLLIECSSQVLNSTDRKGNTVLHTACKSGNRVLINLLIEEGADWSIENDDFQTPFNLVCKNPSEYTTDIMGDITSSVGEIRLSSKEHVNKESLFAACEAADVACIRVILSKFPHFINATDAFGYSCLQLLLRDENLFFGKTAYIPACFDLLLKYNINIHNKTEKGENAFLTACKSRSSGTVIIERLLNLGCDPRCVSNAGNTALLYATRGKGNLSIAKWLLNSRSQDVNKAANDNTTALYHILMSYPFEQEASMECFELALRIGGCPNTRADRSLFEIAAGTFNQKALKLLISHGGRVNAADGGNIMQSVLLHTYKKRESESPHNPYDMDIELERKVLCLKLLLEAGLDPNATVQSKPAIAVACERLDIHFVKPLLAHSASVTISGLPLLKRVFAAGSRKAKTDEAIKLLDLLLDEGCSLKGLDCSSGRSLWTALFTSENIAANLRNGSNQPALRKSNLLYRSRKQHSWDFRK
eukprot:TRINITY_DN10650_c0_g1_i1.p1 TRINITY_DN10650_c0_g1~~TRINITY_DN10650_c0_g1_i1.p1  ORF type:complete len:794 (+),score=119.56 TRINITY_DN10650_c0_g1_i1:65-2446(+)